MTQTICGELQMTATSHSLGNTLGPPPVLQDRADWPRLRRQDSTESPPCSIHGESSVLARWIRSIGPVESSDIQGIETDMLALLEHNASMINGGRGWLAVNGPSLVGKTQSVTAAMLRVHDRLLRDPPAPDTRYRADHVPVIFVSDAGASWPTLLRSIAEFAGVPIARSAPGTETLRQLRTVLPRLGTRMIIIDDAHMLRRVGKARDLTDNLKLTIDALPASFVFSGAGLDRSALLKRSDHSEDEYSAAVQLAGRMRRRDLIAFDHRNDAHLRAWHRRIDTLITRLELIDGFDSSELRGQTFAGNLFHLAGGLTGLSFELLKDTAITAATHHRSPTVDDLIAVTKKRGNK